MKICRVALFVSIVAVMVFGATAAAADQNPFDEQLDSGVEAEAETEDTQPRYDRLGVEEPTTVARAGLAAGQTVHGFVLGLELCVILECDGVRPWTAAMTLGAGTGLTVSLLATSEQGVTPGLARALNHGAAWGGVLGFLSGVVAEADGRPLAGLMAAGQLGGMAAGYGLSQVLRPTSADVLLTTIGGLTGMIYYPLITEGILELGQSERAVFGGMMASSVIGGVGAASVAGQIPMSTGRVVLIGAGGALGSLVGLAIPFMIMGEDLTPQGATAGAVLGSAAGFAAAGYLTREWDDDEDFRPDSATVTIQPTRQGDGAVGTVMGRW